MVPAVFVRGDAEPTVGSLTRDSVRARDAGAAAGPAGPAAEVAVGGASGKRRRRTGGSSCWAIARATAGVLMKAPGRGRTGVAWGYAMSIVPAA